MVAKVQENLEWAAEEGEDDYKVLEALCMALCMDGVPQPLSIRNPSGNVAVCKADRRLGRSLSQARAVPLILTLLCSLVAKHGGRRDSHYLSFAHQQEPNVTPTMGVH